MLTAIIIIMHKLILICTYSTYNAPKIHQPTCMLYVILIQLCNFVIISPLFSTIMGMLATLFSYLTFTKIFLFATKFQMTFHLMI